MSFNLIYSKWAFNKLYIYIYWVWQDGYPHIPVIRMGQEKKKKKKKTSQSRVGQGEE